MRDPGRINRVLTTVHEVWSKQPDTRLGQLIVNATAEDNLFYLEDEELERRLIAHAAAASGDPELVLLNTLMWVRDNAGAQPHNIRKVIESAINSLRLANDRFEQLVRSRDTTKK